MYFVSFIEANWVGTAEQLMVLNELDVKYFNSCCRINHFTLRNDQYVISLCIINTLSTRQVMRIKKIINLVTTFDRTSNSLN